MHFAEICISFLFFFAVTRGERELGESFEFGSGRILMDSRLCVQNIIFNFKLLIYTGPLKKLFHYAIFQKFFHIFLNT